MYSLKQRKENSRGIGLAQRVLNDLQRTRLSSGRMIRFPAHTLPLSPVRKLSLFLNLPPDELTGGREEDGVGEDKQFDRGKAWPSINHSILSGLAPPYHGCVESCRMAL
jgi:hypothetical protein